MYLGSYTRGHVTVLPVLSRGKGFKFRILHEDESCNTVLLVFASKPDLPNDMTAAEISDQLGLHSLRQRHWNIENTCAPAVYFYGLAIWKIHLMLPSALHYRGKNLDQHCRHKNMMDMVMLPGSHQHYRGKNILQTMNK
jgi:hypothetical protein